MACKLCIQALKEGAERLERVIRENGDELTPGVDWPTIQRQLAELADQLQRNRDRLLAEYEAAKQSVETTTNPVS